ncbi:hypothetical protein RND81_01G219400 [Saponaria officinalis]|uniref:DUF7870 domain-containing protein n=1 Tax=Saponaria officinalis TaxID=3572 RepID=A0AAW1NK28_SAPOF
MKLPYYYKYNNMHVLHGDDSSTLVFIRHYYESKVLKLVAQAMLLALLIMVLPQVITTNLRVINNNYGSNYTNFELITREEGSILKSLPLIIHDLANEGLLTTKDKLLIVSNNPKINFGNFKDGEKQIIVSPLDLKRQRFVANNEEFDFVFNDYGFGMVQVFIDRALRLGGVVTVRLGLDPNLAFQVPSNYKIVYFRKIDDSAFIAMKKLINVKTTATLTTAAAATATGFSYRRKLLEFLSEEKKAILGNLEDVLLEPPRSATGKSKTYLRKTKFLPDLLNDSLEGYSRRVYIDVGGGHGSTRWFEQNYPKRNKNFDMYRIETVPETEIDKSEDAWEGPPTQMGISDWLWRNVKAEEYVVMKAEAEVVEEMLKSKAIVLVDELFLECKPFGKGGRTKRAYWECLALYGRLRDFGVAVHQWWG